MDMTKYAGSESKYLKAADLQGRSVKAIISKVTLIEFEQEDDSKMNQLLIIVGVYTSIAKISQLVN